jgi:NAD(P)-dependent dehydrogenase (short-subunit alcohol dehydrogenase family)
MSRPVAVVSGAARGIGLATARRLATTHRVALLDLDAVGIERAAAELGDAMAVPCDITEAGAVVGAVERVVETCGGIDVCISNAGIATLGALRLLDPDALAAQIEVNLVGNWRFVHACLPHVAARRGYVLGVASAAALLAPPGLGAYGASKAGLEHLLDTLRIEVRHLGVDVGVAYLLWIDTEMVRGADRRHPGFASMRSTLRGPGTRVLPVDVAGEAIARGVQRRARRVMVPRSLEVLYRLRGLLGELFDRQTRPVVADLERFTADMVARRGAFAAALSPDEPASEAAARSAGR